jgi:hypothetical protein
MPRLPSSSVRRVRHRRSPVVTRMSLHPPPFTGRSAYRGAGGMQHRFERWGNMLFGRGCLDDRIEHIGKAQLWRSIGFDRNALVMS